MAEDIWTIVGLSSLIASVVTVILGLARDVLVERYRFRRHSEAGYLQSQIQILWRIYFTLARMRKRAVGTRLFKEGWETFKEINAVIEKNILLLPSRIWNEWLGIMTQINKVLDEKDAKSKQEQSILLVKKIEKILDLIEEVANKDLIPKYRSIVGNTVSNLSRISREDMSENEV